MNLRTEDFDYSLPPELIAQNPAEKREESRLMVLDRASGSLEHDRFLNLPKYLARGDLLVANRSKVIPARLHARKATGGAVELLLTQAENLTQWMALARPSRRLRPGMTLRIPGSPLHVLMKGRIGDEQWLVEFGGASDIGAEIQRAGEIPLPPYIHTPQVAPERYQTVYADRDGSIAAPTAGLHFSQALIRELEHSGIAMSLVTLHVGLGTFKPILVDEVRAHTMHPEWGEVSSDVAATVNATHDAGQRVIAVGTTTTRLLESAVHDGRVQAFGGETNLFIYPGFTFRAIDALVTNFHLPRSTLLMLVSAFAGRERILSAYATAVHEHYRFYSFGDAMLIL